MGIKKCRVEPDGQCYVRGCACDLEYVEETVIEFIEIVDEDIYEVEIGDEGIYYD
jgi:hypothetical protein